MRHVTRRKSSGLWTLVTGGAEPPDLGPGNRIRSSQKVACTLTAEQFLQKYSIEIFVLVSTEDIGIIVTVLGWLDPSTHTLPSEYTMRPYAVPTNITCIVLVG